MIPSLVTLSAFELIQEFSIGEQATPRSLLLRVDSDEQPVISIVLPTMNEEDGIAACIRRAVHALKELKLTSEIRVSDSFH